MSIFKPGGDIRGVYLEKVDEELLYKLGFVLGRKISGKEIVVARDPRNGSDSLHEAFIRGLLNFQLKVYDIGIFTTPGLYFAKENLNTYAGAIITASHNPPKYNGLKFKIGDKQTEKEYIDLLAEEIAEFKEIKNKKDGEYILLDDFQEIYIEHLIKLSDSNDNSNVKVVIDAGNGSCSELAPNLFSKKGYNIIELFCDFDGSFPNRGPNPTIKKNLINLQDKVIQEEADLGVAYDCDGDRVMFVDDKGRAINSDKAMAVFIKDSINVKSEKVIYDVKSSNIVPDMVKESGGEPILERTGRVFLQKTFEDVEAKFAGENSGHYFFKELGRDDGIYASLKMADMLANKNQKLSYLIDKLPSYVITEDLRVSYHDDRDILLEKVEKKFKQYKVSKVDGIKIEFDQSSWGLIRKSITEPCVTLRFEAKDENDLEKIVNRFAEAIPEIKSDILTEYHSQ